MEQPHEHVKCDKIAGVQLSHPNKILYQEQGITKADLADYYERVSGRMIPLVQDRLVSLVRCPAGRTGGQCFYDKHARNFPESMKIVQVLEKGGQKKPFACLAGLASIIAAVQMGTLEFHIWGSRIGDLERPDRIVFDIDPGDGVAFSDVKDAAFEIRDKLMEIAALKTIPLLTGGKGIHVIAPLIPNADWNTVLEFAHELAKELEQQHPEKYISQSGKAKRKGLMFIDYLRNSRGATAVAPYSTRVHPGAPVAAPVTWKELRTVEKADKYNLQNMIERIQEKDPWAESYMWKQKLYNDN